MQEYHKLLIVAALMIVAWLLGRTNPFSGLKYSLESVGIRNQVESWYVKGKVDTIWTCVDVSFEKHGGVFGFSTTIFVFEAGYERIAICSEGQDIVPGSKVRFRMRTSEELKLGRLGSMLDCYLMPVLADG